MSSHKTKFKGSNLFGMPFKKKKKKIAKEKLKYLQMPSKNKKNKSYLIKTVKRFPAVSLGQEVKKNIHNRNMHLIKNKV